MAMPGCESSIETGRGTTVVELVGVDMFNHSRVRGLCHDEEASEHVVC